MYSWLYTVTYLHMFWGQWLFWIKDIWENRRLYLKMICAHTCIRPHIYMLAKCGIYISVSFSRCIIHKIHFSP
jgi:hypothetical protein